MLHEIFKGMDNAAETINENFQNGSIVESGENENGSYVRFGNGWQICTVTLDLEWLSSSQMYKEWNYPAEFVERPTISGSKSSSSSPVVRRASLSVSPLLELAQVTLEAQLGETIVSAQQFTARLHAIGRWKE